MSTQVPVCNKGVILHQHDVYQVSLTLSCCLSTIATATLQAGVTVLHTGLGHKMHASMSPN